MQQVKPVGPRAAVIKYDILTALLALSLHDKGVPGRLAQRLTLVITARFNWQSETFKTGLRELAQMWGVTERTAKRELALMRTKGWIVVHRAATRGRVTEHRIDLAEVLDATRAYWVAVGPDFVARMGQGPEEVPATNVVPFNRTGDIPPSEDHTVWGAAALLLYDQDQSTYRAWFAQLSEAGRTGGSLELVAPSQFAASYIMTHLKGRVLAAVSRCDTTITDILIRAN